MTISTEASDCFNTIEIKKDVPVPMHDGNNLYCDIYQPKAEGKFPVILTRMPYGKGEYYCYMPAIGRF